MKFQHTIIATAFGVAIGGVAGWLLNRPSEPTIAPVAESAQPTTARASELESIRSELALEREARFAMAEELDQIWEALGRLSADGTQHGASSAANDPVPPEDPKPASQQPGSDEPRWFNHAALLEAGVRADDVDRLRARFDEHQLDELYLRDLATREGWVSKPRYRKQLKQLREDLRVELGDEDYDRMQFASGRNNRVLVDGVMEHSAAASVGLRKGDVIVRYDGALMLMPLDLRTATVGGDAAQNTAVDVLRGTETLRFYVPRGPLGIRISRTKRPPD